MGVGLVDQQVFTQNSHSYMNVQEGQTLKSGIERPDIEDDEELKKVTGAMGSAEDLNQRE